MGCGASTQVSEAHEEPVGQAKGHHVTSSQHHNDSIPAVSIPRSSPDDAGASDQDSDDELPVDVDSQDVNACADKVLVMVKAKLQLITTATETANPQDLKPPTLNKAEYVLLKYSWLGQALVDGSGALMESLPFGSTVATLMSAMYNTTLRCVKNKRNCRQLVKQIKRCDKQIANAVKARGKNTTWPAGTLQALRDLTHVIKKAAGIIKKYSDHGCIMLFITSQGYQQKFQQLEQQLQKAMTGTAFAFTMASLEYRDESRELREAICSAAGGESDIQKAMQQLRTQQQGKLRELLREKGGFTYQIIDDELQRLEVMVVAMQAKVDAVQTQVASEVQAAQAHIVSEVQSVGADVKAAGVCLSVLVQRINQQQHKAPESLSEYLTCWWGEQVGKFERSATWQHVREALLQTWVNNNYVLAASSKQS